MTTKQDVLEQLDACDHKVPYATQGEAKQQIRVIKRHQGTHQSLRAYPCLNGAHWHLTHMSKRAFRELRRQTASELSQHSDESSLDGAA